MDGPHRLGHLALAYAATSGDKDTGESCVKRVEVVDVVEVLLCRHGDDVVDDEKATFQPFSAVLQELGTGPQVGMTIGAGGAGDAEGNRGKNVMRLTAMVTESNVAPERTQAGLTGVGGRIAVSQAVNHGDGHGHAIGHTMHMVKLTKGCNVRCPRRRETSFDR
eukprot:6468350-Amphidinium_carterae.1